MSLVKEAYELSEQLVQVLNNDEALERERLIIEVEAIVSRREKVVFQLQPPYTDEEKVIGKKLLQLEEEIDQKMKVLFKDVRKDILQFKQQKSSNRSYINPYGQMETIDGMYLD